MQAPVPDLAKAILEERKQKLKYLQNTYVYSSSGQGFETAADQDCESICEGYTQEGYGSMIYDRARNKMYNEIIRTASKSSLAGRKWLEIGCGSKAFLTKMVLEADERSQITAIEVNKHSAAAARKELKQSDTGLSSFRNRYQIVEGMSTEAKVIASVKALNSDSGSTSSKLSALLHEIFGFIASSEGVALALKEASKSFFSSSEQRSDLVVAPSLAATFFSPIFMTPEAAANGNNKELYLSKKALLVRRLDFSKVELCQESRYFEIFDFGDMASNRGSLLPSPAPSMLDQDYEHVFTVDRDGEFNSYGMFIWVGHADAPVAQAKQRTPRARASQTPTPATPRKKKRGRSPAVSVRSRSNTRGTQNRRCDQFPYADQRLTKASKALEKADYCSISSRFGSSSMATNWRNVVLMLDRSVKVRRGDKIMVRSKANLSTSSPSYSFQAAIQRRSPADRMDAYGTPTKRRKTKRRSAKKAQGICSKGKREELGTVNLLYSELYPTFTKLDSKEDLENWIAC